MANKVKAFTFGSKVFPGLIKVVEEGCEVGQAAMKLMGSRNWGVEHWPPPEQVDALREELSDAYATLIFFEKHTPGMIDYERVRAKLDKFERWRKEQSDD